MDNIVELEAESSRILAEMNDLRAQYMEAKKSGERSNLRLLQQMEATSRRYREVNERLLVSSERDLS